MAGIAGFWNLDGRPVEPALISAFSTRLAHRGPARSTLWSDGALVACLSLLTGEGTPDEQPAVDRGGVMAVFDGRLDNRAELADLLPDMPRPAPDARLVLGAYGRFGHGLPRYLSGEFALAVYDQQRKQLVLVRDAIGVRPLYYTRAAHTWIFASEIKPLLAHPNVRAAPNDEFLAGMVMGGLHLREDDGSTCFRGIFSLPPAHVLKITPDGVSLQRYWDFDLAVQSQSLPFETQAERFGELFRQALRRRLRGSESVAVAVSGGLDSSAIFCFGRELAGHDPSLWAPMGLSSVMPDGSPADERSYLAIIEKHCGVSIERIRPVFQDVLSRSRDEIRQVEMPMLDGQWGATRALLRGARARGAAALLTGHWGDQFLFDNTYLVELVGRLRWLTVWRHLREYSSWFSDTAPNEFRSRFLGQIVRGYLPTPLYRLLRKGRRTMRTWRGNDWFTRPFRLAGAEGRHREWEAQPPNHSCSLYREARSRFHTLCMEWNNKVAAAEGMEISFPFLDRDLLVFLMAVPGTVQAHKGVPKALLRQAGRGTVPDAILDRRWKADFTAVVNRSKMEDYPPIAEILGSSSLCVRLGYVGQEALSRELVRVRHALDGPTAVAGWRLGHVLALELWLQEFLGAPREGRSA